MRDITYKSENGYTGVMYGKSSFAVYDRDKETSTPNRMAVLGVRAAESTKRQGRDVFGVRGGGHTAKLHFFRSTTRRKCSGKAKS